MGKEKNIIIEIPEVELDFTSEGWQERLKQDFREIQNSLESKPNPASPAYYTWFWFFIKYGKTLCSADAQSYLNKHGLSPFTLVKDVVGLTMSGGGAYTIGYKFFDDCLKNNDEILVNGIKIRREDSLRYFITASPSKVRACFIQFCKLTDDHTADYELYISTFESILNPVLSEKFGIDDVFQITNLAQYSNILSKIIDNRKELSYPKFTDDVNDNKHMALFTHRRYKAFLEMLKWTNDITIKPNSEAATTQYINSMYRPYITAIKSKPFLLLAGISGTGKSRIVRELARACWDIDSEEFKAQKPKNFEMVQVKPNWHDSSELIGYVSRVSGKAEYVVGDFLKFVARAWENPDVPYFLCLDEMNLAPVEQYFAEYLSVVESRKSHADGSVTTDPILEKADEEWYFNLTASLTYNEDIRKQFNEKGIALPQNLIVVGTVNMDETTFSFSRKVLDRAMTIEMNEVDLYGGLNSRYETIGKLGSAELIGNAVEGVDVYAAKQSACDVAIEYLSKVNDVLEGTPFKIAYRTRNEFLLYVVNNLPYNIDAEGNELPEGFVIARALDEITSMKILSRIEGDDTKVKASLLDNLYNVIEKELNEISDETHKVKSISLAKLAEMKDKLESGYVSFWS